MLVAHLPALSVTAVLKNPYRVMFLWMSRCLCGVTEQTERQKATLQVLSGQDVCRWSKKQRGNT